MTPATLRQIATMLELKGLQISLCTLRKWRYRYPNFPQAAGDITGAGGSIALVYYPEDIEAFARWKASTKPTVRPWWHERKMSRA